MRNLRGFSIGNRGKEQGFAIYEVGFVGIRSNLTVLPEVQGGPFGPPKSSFFIFWWPDCEIWWPEK